jgi:DNA polymerase III alpha subunit
LVTYRTAWLKHYYPDEFMAALMNSFVGLKGHRDDKSPDT